MNALRYLTSLLHYHSKEQQLLGNALGSKLMLVLYKEYLLVV